MGADNTSNGWNGSCSSPNAGDLCVNSASSPYSFTTVAGSTYDWWVGAWDSSGGNASINGPSFTCNTTPPTPTPTPTATPTATPAPGSPIISSLTIGNVAPDPSFSPGPSPARISGLQTSEGGSNWYNPISITLSANGSDGLADSTVKEYYVAFYNKTGGLAPTTSTTDFLTNASSTGIQDRLITDPTSGFLLKYDTNAAVTHQPAWSVWEALSSTNASWKLIPNSGYSTIYDYSSQPILFIYQNGPRSWKVQIWKIFLVKICTRQHMW